MSDDKKPTSPSSGSGGCPAGSSTKPCPLQVEPEYHLHVDADRDGTVDDDRTGIDTWTWGKGKKGAIILCNNDDDGSASKSDNDDSKINSGNDKDEVAPFEIRRIGPEPPAGWEGVIEVSSADKDRVRIFESRSASAPEVIGPAKGESYKLPDLKFKKKEMGIEALRYAGDGFDGEVTLTFKLKKGGSVAQTETAKLRVAPWLMPNHRDKAKKVFVVDAGSSNNRFRTDLGAMVGAAGCTLEEHAAHDIWMQDCMEIGFANLAPSSGFHTVMRNPRDRPLKTFAETLRDADFGYHEQGVLGSSTFDSTGNLECTPPVAAGGKKYPWGRIYFGPGRSGEEIDSKMKAFLEKQVVQKPIEIGTNWLLVGHVDEMISFVPAPGGMGFKLLLASAKRAYEILDNNKAAHGSARMLVGRTFDGSTSVEVSITEFLATGTAGHSGSTLRSYNNARQSDLDSTRNKLKAECGLAESDIIDVPGLFMENHSSPPYADALTAGMVNMLVINKHCIVPKPFGPVVSGKDLFEEEIKSKLTPLGLTVKFLDDWYEYHVNLGEVHCGTNTLREPTSAKWWEFEP